MELKAAARPALLRSREPHAHARVTFVELFFDLVFVFAITQLSHALLHDLTPAGALQTAAAVPGRCGGCGSTPPGSRTGSIPDRAPVRLLLFAADAGRPRALHASIPEAFGERGLAFAARLRRHAGRAHRLHAVGDRAGRIRRCGGTSCASSSGWRRRRPSGSPAASPTATRGSRLWAMALAIEYVSPSAGFWVPGLGRSTIGDWHVEGGAHGRALRALHHHRARRVDPRHRRDLRRLAWTADAAAAFVVAFIGSVAMWWVYFNIGAERGTATSPAPAIPAGWRGSATPTFTCPSSPASWSRPSATR